MEAVILTWVFKFCILRWRDSMLINIEYDSYPTWNSIVRGEKAVTQIMTHMIVYCY